MRVKFKICNLLDTCVKLGCIITAHKFYNKYSYNILCGRVSHFWLPKMWAAPATPCLAPYSATNRIGENGKLYFIFEINTLGSVCICPRRWIGSNDSCF
jgi:hypothetical protein